jgi:DJ-1 family protein
MARALVPLAEGFEEIEAVTVIDVLRRGEVEVVVAGLGGAAPVLGSRGILITPDLAFDEISGRWDAVILPGGLAGTRRLAAHDGLLMLLKARVDRGQLVGAICAAPLALDRAGALPSGSFTCYPGIEAELRTPGRVDEPVVDAGAVVTSQGPGTAMAFAIHLLRRLIPSDRADEVARGLLTR